MRVENETRGRKMNKRKHSRLIRRKFTLPSTQGAAALLVGSTAEGKPLLSMKRQGNKVVAIYGG